MVANQQNEKQHSYHCDQLTLQENNVSFSQFPEDLPNNPDVLNFSSQLFEDFLDDSLLLQFDNGDVLDFDDGLDKFFNSPMLDSLVKKGMYT